MALIGRVAEAELSRLYTIKRQLKDRGKADVCPNWKGYDWLDCKPCMKMFPKTCYPQNYEIVRLRGLRKNCPCSVYSKKYLLSRLDEIIKYSESCEEGRKNGIK